MLFDKYFLAIEHIDVVARHFPVHQQRQPSFLHGRKHVVTFTQIGDTGIGVGGRSRRIVFDSLHKAALYRARDFARRCIVSEIQRHQRFEITADRYGIENSFAIGQRVVDGSEVFRAL